jgi:hypothetical protein
LPDNTLKIADPAFLGIAYTPHSTDNVAVFDGTAKFDNFVVLAAAPDLGIFEANVDVEWAGNLGAAGSASYDAASDTYTIVGSGADTWTDFGDNFHFVYKEWTGDFVLEADIAIELGPSDWRKAMMMARQSLDGDAMYCASRLRSGDADNEYGQFSMQWRDGPGVGTGGSTPGADRVLLGKDAPARERFVRTGNDFTIFYLADTGQWVQVGAAKTVVLQDPILVGIGVCAHQLGDLATGTFKNVILTGPTGVDWELY